MGNFSSPYNFVPLNKNVYIPLWHDKVSHDIPFEDGEDGYIEVKWENVSPLFIRDSSVSSDKRQNIYSMHVVTADGSRLYFIPGSSMKGMLRSVLSIMSFGKMTDYNNSYFGHREFNTKLSERRSYQKKMENVRYGWLSQENEDYYLYPCIGEAQKITIAEVKERFGEEYDELVSAWERNKYIGNNTFPKTTLDGKTYRIFATGKMHNKEHELLIPVDTEREIKLDNKTIDSFFTVYSPTKDFENYEGMLEEGKEIPVSFIRGADYTTIAAIGMGRMFRYPYKQSVKALVEKGQPKAQYAQKHDLSETIFGWADEQSCMKGRVQICNAFAEKPIADSELCDVISGVLGQPKASFYPLYLQQNSNNSQYNTYDNEDAQISGRKRYRIHKGATTTELPKGNDNENTISTLRPIREGQRFAMRINVHNLRKMEIGALLSAITFHHTPNVYHNIGAAKSFGYGKLKCIGIELHGLKYDESEYLRTFEREMNSFTQKTEHCDWISSLPMKSLVAIASEHDDADVKMMGLDDYTDCKLNTHFSRLHDASDGLKSAFSKKDVFKEQHADEYAQIEALGNNNNFDAAKSVLEKLIENLKFEQIPAEEENILLNNIEKEIETKKAKDAEERLQNGFGSILNERFPENAGNNSGKYKVKDWRTCWQKTQRWLKDKQAASLDAEELDVLAETVVRLMTSPANKNEKKNWEKFDSSIWKSISELLSAERAQQIFKGAINE